MASKGTNEDGCSPECLLTSEPVKDPYSTDEKHEQDAEDKLPLTGCNINSSNSSLSEILSHFRFNYDSHVIGRVMNEMDAKVTFVEYMKFCFPDGLPDSYYPWNLFEDIKSRDEVLKLIYREFMKNPLNLWLSNEFNTDYSKATDEEIYQQGDKLYKYSQSLENREFKFRGPSKDTSSACTLAKSLHQFLVLLRKNLAQNCSDKTECNEDRPRCDCRVKAEEIKSVVYDMFSYLEIQTVFSGQAKLDFKYKLDPDENSFHNVKVRPDILGYVPYGPEGLNGFPKTSEAFVIVEVFGPCSTCIDSNIKLQDDKCPHLVDKCKKLDDKCNFVKSCGPESCSTGIKADKLYGQLALQLHGALYHRRKLLQNKQSKSIALAKAKMPDYENIFGFFVMNEFVYLAKICGSLKEEESATVTYIKDLWFNLNKPNDRMALLGSLFHLRYMHVMQANHCWANL